MERVRRAKTAKGKRRRKKAKAKKWSLVVTEYEFYTLTNILSSSPRAE